jgi:ribosomal protein S18 acetylase RimI-like enzyme
VIDVSRVQPTAEGLETYRGVSSEFEVTSRVNIKALESGSIVPVPIKPPYTKSLDDEDPRDWPHLYDLDLWALFIASDDGAPAGACAVARGVSSLYFDSRPDEALLWDIRVSPEHRQRGAGRALLEAAASWARADGCTALLIETQDTNVAACRLYVSAGCKIQEVRHGAYKEYPQEVLIVWRLDLS